MADIQDITGTSAFSHAAEREVAYSRIQEEILASEAVTRCWKSRHNDLSIIFRLPAELLSAIFVLTRDLWPDSIYWISISHICSYWRRVALACPDLWAKIPFHRPNWAEEMLTRSKVAPLDIRIIGLAKASPKKGEDVIIAALQQFSRIKELTLRQTNDYYYQEHTLDLPSIVKLIVGPIPLLIACDIQFSVSNSENKLSDTLLSDSPSLRYITLVRCGLNWQSLVLSNMRELSVEDIPLGLLPPMQHVLIALSHMPVLESLNLYINFASSQDIDASALTVANLPSLGIITIRSRLHDCLILLSHIVYPDTAIVNITSEVDATTPATQDTLQKLAERLQQRLRSNINSLRIHNCQLQLVTSYARTPKLIPRPQVTLNVIGIDFFLLPSQIIASSLRVLSLQQLESVHIFDSNLETDDWLFLFGDLTKLRTMHVGCSYRGFINALSSGTAAIPGQSTEAAGLKFKVLHHLVAHGWVLDESHRGKAVVKCLKGCLTQRRKKGFKLIILGLENCRHVEDAEVDKLKKVVKTVQWDGEANYTTDEEDYYETESDSDDYNYGYL